MTDPTIESETLDTLLRQYEADGYEVDRHGSLPAPLEGFRPDAIVRKGNETIVIEMKPDRMPPDSHRRLDEIASAVESQPGWRFQLVTYRRPEPLNASSAELLETWIRQAEEIADTSPTASLLLTASVLEGTLRHLRTFLGSELAQRRETGPSLIRSMQIDGQLSDRQADRLLNFWQIRNPIAHGLVDPDADTAEIGPLLQWAAHVIRPGYRTVEQMVDWFFENYQDPWEAGLPHESDSGFIWMGRGPHDAADVLTEQFPGASELDISDAVAIVEEAGHEWASI